MSHSYYDRIWASCHIALNDLQIYENKDNVKPELDSNAAFQTIGTMYIQYIQIYKKLEKCCDQIVHPQKRILLYSMINAVIGRILELKNEMVELEHSEYHYFDDILSDMKLTPNDVELPVPTYFTKSRLSILNKRKKKLDQILSKLGPTDEKKENEVEMTIEEAIQLIQINERKRQGCLRAKFMLEIKQQEERERRIASNNTSLLDPDVAAIRIQKLWKGFEQRLRTKQDRSDEMRFIGMMHSENDCGAGIYTKNKIIIKDKETTEKRRQMQDIQQEEYERTLVSVKERIFETEGADIKEEMKDQIRQWFLECRDATGKLADYPNEEDGGSASLFRNISPEELEQELAAKKEEKGKKKEKKEKEKKKTKKQADNKGDEDGWTMKKSIIAEKINEDLKEYNYVWKNIDESNNFSQRYDLELIKKEKRIEVDNEIRLQVDEIMRQELKNLKMALEKDKGKKGKKAKNSGKRKKKKGGSGKKKKKRDKDLTIDRSIESLYEELVMEGIIIKPDVIKVNDFVGEYSYLGTTLRQINIEPMPSLSDTRRVATQFGILPLGSEYIHENSPLIKSLLFAGPHKTGKKMLVNIICNETGANLFDLTSETIAGKYPGKEGLKLLMNTVFKVAKELQPSVIWIDNCEKMFKKKIPKADTSDPKRIRKELPKAIKNIKSTDRILVIGTSNCPYDADIKKICAIYQKIILIPRPDYASRHLFWRTFLQNNGAIITDNLDISSLSKISNGFTPGQIENVIKTVLTERRKAKLIKRPLKSLEFINNLAKHEPVFKEEEEAFKVWYSKTPLGKKRTKASQNPDDVKVKKKKK